MEPPSGTTSGATPEQGDQTQASRNPRPTPRGTASYQRRRAVKACQVCRARRTKCDNLKPSCSFCLKVGATCVQSPVDLSSFDPASLKILERLDSLEELFKSATLSPSQPSSGESFDNTRTVQGGDRHLESDEDPTINLSMVMPWHRDDMLTLPAFQDWFLYEPSPNGPCQVGVFAESPVSTINLLNAQDLEPMRVKDLLDNFFNYVHVKNPIFNERVTRGVVQSTILNGIDRAPESCLSLLICALGSIATPFGPSPETMPGSTAYANALSFFHAAQNRIGMLLHSDDIVSSQCLFLSGVFMMHILQPLKGWRYFVQALAHCQQLSFLSPRSQDQYQGASPLGHDFDPLHQAIYWSSWKSERELRSGLHLPDFVPNDHGVNLYPPFFPTPPEPGLGESDFMDLDQQREQTSWYFYLAEISLRRLSARIGDAIESMMKIHSTRRAFLLAAAAAAPAYEAQVREWTDSLPPCLSFAAPAEDDDVCRFVLRGHVLNLLETIYWPFLVAHLDGSALGASDLALFACLAQKAVDHHALRLTVNEPGYKHRHHGTFPMMQSCTRSALTLLATWLHNQSPPATGGHGANCFLNMPSDWMASATTFVQTLEFWSSELPSLDRARRILEHGLSRVMD